MNLYDLREMPVNFELYESLQRGNAHLWNVKDKVGATWKSRIRSRGGYWTAECLLNDTLDTQEKWFQEALMREIRLTVGGQTVWRGFNAEMELRRHGEVFRRWWGDLHNRVKAYYTRIAENLFTNGSVESGTWTSYGTPTTNEQSTTWKTHGVYSCHLVADEDDDGATIQTGITVVADKRYDCSVQVNIISGTWRMGIYQVGGAAIDVTTQEGPAQCKMSASIPEDSAYAGDILVRIFTESATGEIYCDEASFREAPVSAETSYYEDADSQVEYGVLEEALLEAGMSDAAANAKAYTTLRESAWPRAKTPNEGLIKGQDGLTVTFYGYVFTLRNKFSLLSAAEAASTLVTNVLGEAAYVSAGIIETNSMIYQVEDRGPMRGWEVIKEVVEAGDASGGRWTGGVYADRLFNYQAAANELIGHWRGGELYHMAGGLLEPWYALPGNVYMDDMPLGPADLNGIYADNPRVAFIEEVEFDAAAWLKDGHGLKFRQEASGE